MNLHWTNRDKGEVEREKNKANNCSKDDVRFKLIKKMENVMMKIK